MVASYSRASCCRRVATVLARRNANREPNVEEPRPTTSSRRKTRASCPPGRRELGVPVQKTNFGRHNSRSLHVRDEVLALRPPRDDRRRASCDARLHSFEGSCHRETVSRSPGGGACKDCLLPSLPQASYRAEYAVHECVHNGAGMWTLRAHVCPVRFLRSGTRSFWARLARAPRDWGRCTPLLRPGQVDERREGGRKVSRGSQRGLRCFPGRAE